jgi:hypothetical protein
MVDYRRTNAEIRQWYLEQVSSIPELNQQWLAAGLSARERAERAWRMRHTARLEARAMMTDLIEVELLRARDMALYGHADGPTFAFLVEQGRRSGLTDQAIYEAIIEGAYRTNVGLNRRFGL